MRVVFMGYQTWGHSVLNALLTSRHEIPLVITHPDSDHAYESIWSDSVAKLASDYNIPCLVRVYANDDECQSIIASAEPDIIVSSNWRTWVSPKVCQIAKHGAINVHDGLLPQYGGFAPLNWALINDEKEVGVTVHAMTEELDLGPILLQQRVPVRAADDVVDLFRKTISLFPEMILHALELIATSRAEWSEQNPAEATFFHKRSAEDSRIDWRCPARRIVNLVRAQADPYPNAFCYHQNQMLRIVKASVSARRYGGTAGRIFCREGAGVVVVSGPRADMGVEFGTRLEVLRMPDGDKVAAGDYFVSMGGYLTSYP
jgi:methionyl-tRNA formyltransferase